MTEQSTGPTSTPWVRPAEEPSDHPHHRAGSLAGPTGVYLEAVGRHPVASADSTSPDGVPTEITSGADDDLFADEAWATHSRTNVLTRILLVATLVVAGFAAGVLVERSYGHSGNSASAVPSGMPGGSFPAGFDPNSFGGSMPGGSSGASDGSAASGVSGGSGGRPGTSGGAASSAETPVVVGSVDAVSGHTITIKNLGGKRVVVTVSATTKVTIQGLTPLAVGDTVSVAGTKTSDTAVTATSIIVTGT